MPGDPACSMPTNPDHPPSSSALPLNRSETVPRDPVYSIPTHPEHVLDELTVYETRSRLFIVARYVLLRALLK